MADTNKPPPKFIATGVRRPLSQKSARHAIYCQLIKNGLRVDTVKGNSASMYVVRQLWRRKLKAMQAVGWPRLATQRAFNYMVYCPPVGITTNDRTMVCGQHGFCPFCYGRRMLNIFKDTERVLYGDNHSLEMIRPELKLVAFRSQFSQPYASSLADIPYLRQYVKYHARWEYTLFQGVTGYIQHVLYPVKKHLVIVRSGFVLTKADVDVTPYVKHSKTASAEVFEPSKANLYRTVVRYMYYPPGLLSVGNNAMLPRSAAYHAKLLVKMKNARLAFRFGRDLNSANEESDDGEVE